MEDISEVSNDIANAVEKAIDIVVDKIIDEMQKEIDAQGIGTGKGTVYNPTGQFKQAWKPMVKKRLGLTIEGGMEYDPTSMTSVPSNFQHGSPIPSDNDSREYLADILFDGNPSTLWVNETNGGWWTNPRDAWSAMENYVDVHIDEWFDNAMTQLTGLSGRAHLV